MPSEPKRERLPFEPQQNRKKPEKQQPTAPTTVKKERPASTSKASMAVPEIVSQRMARRMAFFCGIPTVLGMSTFVISYLIVSHHWFKLPNVAVLLVSLGFFGIGVLGLTYGVLSASWDEERVGSWLGLEEFSTNFTRMTEAWRATRQQKS